MPGHASPVEALIRSAIQLQRASNLIAVDRERILRALFDDLAAQVARIDPTAPAAMRYRRHRIGKLLERVEELTGEAFTEWHKGVRSDLARLGRVEGLQAQADLIASLGEAGSAVRTVAPTQNMLKAILDTNPFQGETLRGWADVQEAATVRRVRQQLNLGLMEEESIDQLVRRIRGRSNGRGGFTGGVMQTTTREAASIVRTAVTEVASTARFETFKQNPRVTTTYTYVATLDSRTTFICMDLDGSVFPYDEGHPTPPQHWNCRSSVVANIDWDRLGLEPPEVGERAARDASGKRIQVSADTTYGDWLKSQPASLQDEILGPSRAKLFRDGKVSLSDLVKRDKSIVTLDELERKLEGSGVV